MKILDLKTWNLCVENLQVTMTADSIVFHRKRPQGGFVFPKISGIYLIQASRYLYVGMSASIFDRWKSHARHMCRAQAGSVFAPFYNRLSDIELSQVKFSLIEQSSNEDLFEKELYWIDRLKPNLNVNYDKRLGKLSNSQCSSRSG